jgi:hypothetical protein
MGELWRVVARPARRAAAGQTTCESLAAVLGMAQCQPRQCGWPRGGKTDGEEGQCPAQRAAAGQTTCESPSRRCWGWRNASRGNACGPGVGKRLGRRARGRLTWLQTLLHERHAMQRAAGCEANTRDRYIYKDDAIYIVYPRQPHKWSYTATAKRLRNVRRGAHPHKHGACRYCADTIHCTQASDSHRPRPAVDIYTLPFRRHPRAKQGEQTMLV